MVIMYLPKENFTCLKKHITTALIYLPVRKQYINSLENSMKQDITSLVNSVDPADQDPHCFHCNM